MMRQVFYLSATATEQSGIVFSIPLKAHRHSFLPEHSVAEACRGFHKTRRDDEHSGVCSERPRRG
jgi:hypothetical protein